MLTDKEAKKKYVQEFYRNPDKYYATEVLKEEGFHRGICSNCQKPFWNVNPDRKVCGDPACGEVPFAFIGNTPAKRSMDYIEVWKVFAKMFKKFGYTPIKRYPIIARWNPTMEYTNASIAAFQPYVISGEAKPPAKKLVIPQLCFRTVDIDNVGITGSHATVFCMIGQHMFVRPSEWDQNLVFRHIHAWLKKGLGLPNEEITFHEDAWAGGGNLGPCMEFFSRGNELGNQVYMMYEQTETGIRGLDLKVLDMGMGQERNAWFSRGVNTLYDASFPTVITHLLKRTGLKFDKKLIGKYVTYGGLLNLDEVEDIDKAWQTVAKKTGTDVETLKNNILPLAGVYSIAEHSRSLLVMFNDGALPSNVGDAYNLRIILRRMLGFIDKYGWDIDVHKLFDLHARYLKPQYPELSENLENVKNIYDVEKEKYQRTGEKSRQIIARIILKDVSAEDLIKLYDSQGIQPELIAEEAKRSGKNIHVPDNFYALVSELHDKEEQKHATKKKVDIDFGDLPATKALYFDNYKRKDNEAKVLKISDKYVILDETIAYPTSGGQLHDTGTINREEFVDVFKQGPLIVHQMKEKPGFKEGDKVKVEIDIKRRLQLAKHHTATHIVNEAARRVLGNHANQASAFKDIDKAHLDVTHYAAITNEKLDEIERIANSIVRKAIKIDKRFMKRNEAEKKYGTGIYQGGVAPGKEVRIVNITGTDVEACGGTHLDSTAETEKIIIISSERIQDNISRITFVAGPAADEYEKTQKRIMKEVESLLGTTREKTIKAAQTLFEKWKKMRKDLERKREKKASAMMEKIDLSHDIIVKILPATSAELKNITRDFKRTAIVLFGENDRSIVAAGNGKVDIGALVRSIVKELDGKGGGSPTFAQGVYKKEPNIDKVRSMIKS